MRLVFHKPHPVASEEDLVDIPGELVRDPKKTYKARDSALRGLRELCMAADKDGVSIVVISSHRKRDEQEQLFLDAEKRHGRGKGILWLAPPGYSEHHTGWVFDLADKGRPETDDEPSFERTDAFRWLSKRAGGFGFEMSFPPGNWQGIGYEPWHWRFAGDGSSGKHFHPGPLKAFLNLVESVYKGIVFRLGV